MIAKLAEIKNENPDVAEGTLVMWSQGQGELDATVVDSREHRALFAPVREAYYAAKASPIPAYPADEPIFDGSSTMVEIAHVEPMPEEPIPSVEVPVSPEV